ncbi:hypothetical protein IMSHALPRED_002466 [Imshaugia aleurites]|uniref:Uncharacterized protein n=1 Tax=Imshaugia aleurites TaxID=172621 RepID=A0A8H3J5S5_9LECA|nr:hypothetical protein IMSHALPRED_002466 [Imshaugia aleurites]
MSKQQSFPSGSQPSSGSSNSPAQVDSTFRKGKVIPDDGEGPLKDENGILTTHDEFDNPTNTDRPLVVEGPMLVNAVNKNRLEAGGEADADPSPYLFKIDDKVRLEYQGDLLIAVTKINEKSPEEMGGVDGARTK